MAPQKKNSIILYRKPSIFEKAMVLWIKNYGILLEKVLLSELIMIEVIFFLDNRGDPDHIRSSKPVVTKKIGLLDESV